MQWEHNNPDLWRYGQYAVSKHLQTNKYRALYIREGVTDNWLLRLGDFDNLKDAQQFVEIHYATGA